MKKANFKQRIEMVKAMETIMRSLNDEEIFESWLLVGVADGDINEDTTDEDLMFYIESDEYFADLMCTFCRIMHRALKADAKNNYAGTLYVDDICSKKSDI